MQVRLRADKAKWKVDEVPTLKAEARNQGKHRLFISPGKAWALEVDGHWYRWRWPVKRAGVLFWPGSHVKWIRFTLAKDWRRRKGQKPLRLSRGKHIVRVASYFTSRNTGPFRAISNPVEIKILPKKGK